MPEEIKQISNVYSEQEMLDIIDYTFSNHTDVQLERELTAHLQLVENKDHLDYYDRTSNEVWYDVVLGALGIKYLIKAGKKIFTPEAVVKLVDGLQKLGEKIGQLLKGACVSFREKMVEDRYIRERFDLLASISDKYKDREELYVQDAVEYEVQFDRFRGLKSIIDDVYQMSKSSDTSAFSSDRIFDQMADKSNTVMKTVEPMAGSSFRTFKWVKPFSRDFNLKNSDWYDKDSVENMKGLVLSLKEDAFTKLEDAAKHMKSILEPYDKTDAEHVRFDDYEKMTKEYGRGYAIMKFVQDMQSIVLKEINTFCSTGIAKLTKFQGVDD